MGAGFEARAKRAPEVRMAVNTLSEEIPDLYKSIERKQWYEADYEEKRAKMKFGKDGIMSEAKTSGGSLIVPDERAELHIRNILTKKELNTAQIEASVELWRDSEPLREIQIAESLTVKKWPQHPSKPLLDGKPLPLLVPLKVAYEFLTQIAGDKALADNTCLNSTRRALREADFEYAKFVTSRFSAGEYRAFHGICFEGNKPDATIQIRLFGKLAYRVRFPRVRLNAPNVAYTHNIVEKNEYLLQ